MRRSFSVVWRSLRISGISLSAKVTISFMLSLRGRSRIARGMTIRGSDRIGDFRPRRVPGTPGVLQLDAVRTKIDRQPPRKRGFPRAAACADDHTVEVHRRARGEAEWQ